MQTLTWRTDVYKYVTRAKPDDANFQQEGGEIYIIMVHSGLSKTGGVTSSIGWEYVQTVKAPSSVIPVKQYPATNSGTQSGDNWSYNIGFKQTMPMFKNGANELLDFPASYTEDFVRNKSQQRGAEITNGVEFSVHLEEDVFGEWPVIAFSVFKCLDPSVFPVTFTFEATAGQRRNNVYTPQGTKLSKDVVVDFAFKP
ncbi:hypothetical protein BDN71DRAFT_477430 [Pleurotus eryngii]|uniref:Uncharacterized protein n=1 Tax=Pleurotus eryngii TaxID=5323 RepID=A0A9P6A845_PLEER|nr:hypothetical protein BDN71DRAFT_477430 [Pleurotus eryngii]